MGTLHIEGNAYRMVEYDGMKLTIKFEFHKDTTTEAHKAMIEQSEEFLNMLEKIGIPAKNINMGDCSIGQYEYDYDNETTPDAQAKREFVLRLGFDMTLLNEISNLITQKGFFASLECDYFNTKAKEIHDELLKEALVDSKRKAELIADSMDKKIIGINTLKHDRYSSDYAYNEIKCTKTHGISLNTDMLVSNTLKPPVEVDSERVEVEWIIE